MRLTGRNPHRTTRRSADRFPPMQKGASFNLDALKAKIEAARAAMGK
jgi:hypothetical protein